jgi:hypothetical protein
MRTPNSDVAVRDVAQEVIGALLDARDFLGYQLSHANGCMSEVDLNEIADRHLTVRSCTDAELARKTIILAGLIPGRVDVDVVATVFRCEIVQAGRVLRDLESSGKWAQASNATLPRARLGRG